MEYYPAQRQTAVRGMTLRGIFYESSPQSLIGQHHADRSYFPEAAPGGRSIPNSTDLSREVRLDLPAHSQKKIEENSFDGCR